MKTFKDLNVGDYIHIVGYLCGGYMQSLLIDAIENNGEYLLLTTTDGKQFEVTPNETSDWSDEQFVDVYVDENDAWAMVQAHDKHYATQIKKID